MTDFRALCAELIDDLELADWPSKLKESFRADIQRARAALAQPEPEGPSIEDVEELCEEHCFNVEGYESIECLQGLINEAIARWGHQPAPPADGEVAECAAELLQRQALVP